MHPAMIFKRKCSNRLVELSISGPALLPSNLCPRRSCPGGRLFPGRFTLVLYELQSFLAQLRIAINLIEDSVVLLDH
jgi:hypothetical protein